VRIVGGRFRGLALADVGAGDPAAHLRPTSDRVRESLFNVLQGGRYGTPLAGARVLDLFAGTGALGLEALSRGAARATFVDSGATALALIARNIAKSRTEGDTLVVPRDATRLGPGTPHDLVFLDPPYGRGLGEAALAAAREGGWLAPEALIVWEERAPMPPPEDFTPLESRRYGGTHVTFLRAP
jgi:16S rRNA (guanine966-N2)-methyltransferase